MTTSHENFTCFIVVLIVLLNFCRKFNNMIESCEQRYRKTVLFNRLKRRCGLRFALRRINLESKNAKTQNKLLPLTSASFFFGRALLGKQPRCLPPALIFDHDIR